MAGYQLLFWVLVFLGGVRTVGSGIQYDEPSVYHSRLFAVLERDSIGMPAEVVV